MTTSSTPVRVKASVNPHMTAPSTPRRATAGSHVTASPQVKAALAAIRQQRLNEQQRQREQQQQQQTHASTTTTTTATLNSQSTEHASSHPVTNHDDGTSQSTFDNDDNLLQWGTKSITKLVNDARKTGRLNLASSSLTTVPRQVYTRLIHRTSRYYPEPTSDDSPTALTKHAFVDLTMRTPHDDNEPTSDVNWYEQQELTALIMSSNELTQIDEAIAGFDELQTLDIHNNLLTSVPVSIAYMTNLTFLNLSSNNLTTFPTQLLRLERLKELNLSSNKLKTLWNPLTWRDDLDKLLSSRATTPSHEHDGSFENDNDERPQSLWSNVASTPNNKPRHNLVQSVNQSTAATKAHAPFPNLTTLDLSNNPLQRDLFSSTSRQTPMTMLPTNLAKLNLSVCYLDEYTLSFDLFAKQLKNLETLTMTDCGFKNQVFNEDHKADQDDGHDVQSFPSLKEFDLSRNEFNSLTNLDKLFKNRNVQYFGLDQTCSRLIRKVSKISKYRLKQDSSTESPTTSSNLQDDLVDIGDDSDEDNHDSDEAMIKIHVWNNPLKDEQARRRRLLVQAMRNDQTQSQDVTDQQARRDESTTAQAQDQEHVTVTLINSQGHVNSKSHRKNLDDDLDEHKDNHSIEINGKDDRVESHSEASLNDEAVILVSGAFTSATFAVNLSGRNLDQLPTPTTGQVPTSLATVRTLNMSHNAMTSLPLGSIETWSWQSSLTTLNLSRNRLTNETLVNMSNNVVLSNLTLLDLSWNQFTNEVQHDETTILNFVQTLAPRLRELDVSYNRLMTLSGISNLLLPSSSSSMASNNERLPSIRPTLETLCLRGNKIHDLDQLVKVAQSVKHDTKLMQQWSLKVIDLGDNDIARLSPALGLLPHSIVIHLTGNKFRIPRREVYDNPSERLVLPWLSERL
ncbi:hypothetical protein OIO90_003370 [Microbotryomycetes sp. JL221]|nr:hypothetical protein OIO90_003370 [Microbotryomycetes sp. JL221]